MDDNRFSRSLARSPSVPLSGRIYFRFDTEMAAPTKTLNKLYVTSADVTVLAWSKAGDQSGYWEAVENRYESVYPTLWSKSAAPGDYGTATYSAILKRWEVTHVWKESETDDGDELPQVIWGYLKSDLNYMGSSSIDEYQPVFSGAVLSTWEDASKVTGVHDSMLASGYKLESGVWVSADLRDGKYFVRAARTCSVEA